MSFAMSFAALDSHRLRDITNTSGVEISPSPKAPPHGVSPAAVVLVVGLPDRGMSLAGVAASSEHPAERRYVGADCWNCLRALKRLWRYRPEEPDGATMQAPWPYAVS